jgi:fructose-1,6-bisphosphatase/inositol monophosphatase family enzyme
MSPWDGAALVPVLQEAGATFTDWQGNSTIYGGNAFSTNGHLFEQVMKHING